LELKHAETEAHNRIQLNRENDAKIEKLQRQSAVLEKGTLDLITFTAKSSINADKK